MQTKQIIQASANVIRITRLSKGNIYKRFDSNDYTYYGVVTDVLNDGVNTIITAIEYRKSWSSIDVSQKVIKGEQDYVLFPATPEELELEFKSVVSSKEQDIIDYQNKIKEAEMLIEQTNKLISGEMQKELSTPDFKEMPQVEYNEKLQALN